jgi:HK97 gp10 family phage protein
MQIEGLDETVDRLSELSSKVSKGIVRKGLRAGAKIIRGGAQAEVHSVSGITSKNIKVRAGRSRKGMVSVTVGIGVKYFSGPAFYAAFDLFGHRVGSRKLGNARKEVPANNWLNRACQAKKSEAVEVITDTIITGIEAAAGGAA